MTKYFSPFINGETFALSREMGVKTSPFINDETFALNIEMGPARVFALHNVPTQLPIFILLCRGH